MYDSFRNRKCSLMTLSVGCVVHVLMKCHDVMWCISESKSITCSDHDIFILFYFIIRNPKKYCEAILLIQLYSCIYIQYIYCIYIYIYMAKITHSHLNVFKVSTFLCYGCVSLSECGLPPKQRRLMPLITAFLIN